MSPQPNEELKPYTVEVDDHSDDCGTVYRLKGPNVGILSKDEELLKERAEDFNLGFEMGRRSQEAPQGKREWSLEVEDARTLAAYWLMTDERSRREMWQSDIKKICEQLLKATEVQAALSGGGDERWVLDELKKWIKSLDKKYLDGLYYPRLYGAILEKLSDLESQASGKVKTND